MKASDVLKRADELRAAEEDADSGYAVAYGFLHESVAIIARDEATRARVIRGFCEKVGLKVGDEDNVTNLALLLAEQAMKRKAA